MFFLAKIGPPISFTTQLLGLIPYYLVLAPYYFLGFNVENEC